MSNIRPFRLALLAPLLAACALLAPAARAQLVISDTLTGAASTYDWKSLNGACLTAGNNTGNIPACSGLSYYGSTTLVGGVTGRLPDPVGQGALRLTNGDTTTGSNGNNQTGAVVSNFTFPSNQGLQVTFSTVTYGGNAYTNSSGQKSGADGITFFLADGSQSPSVGGLGGSLGYSCSNVNSTYNGVQGGYLGVGIDEYGNFVNGASVRQTTTTTVSTTSTAGTQTGNMLTDSSGNPTSMASPSWVGSTPATIPVGTVTGSPTSSSAIVTNTAPNPTTTSTSGSAIATPANWNRTGSIRSGSSRCGSSGAYCAVGTYTTAGQSTQTTTLATTYSISTGDNTASSDPAGSGPHPGRISVRGAGNVNWAWLNATYPALFPNSGMSSGAQQTAVQKTCAAGFPYNNTGSAQTVNGVTVPAGGYYPTAVPDYPLLATSQLPSGTTIYNQEATNSPLRGSAVPITYALSITQNGLLNMSYSYNGGTAVPVISNQSISASNGAVPATFRFGFSAGTGGGSNVHEITCFKAAQLNAASSSAGVNVQQSARVQEGTQVYLAYYHPTNWWGQLTATNLVYYASTDTVKLAPLANWDASCVLTGGSCNATGGSNTVQPSGTGAAGSGTRQLMTWSTNSSGVAAGVPLQWSNLNATQQGLLTAGDTMPGSPNADRLGWLRGDRQNEIGGSGTDAVFRARNGVLGDLVDSSPTWVGPPSLPYKGPWRDALNPTTTMPEGTSYATFATSNATRTNVVYVGGNDGLMHGFRAGAYLANGQFDTTGSIAPNDGQELIGYMPSSALATIHNTNSMLDVSSPNYAHALSVDATPGTGDLYYNGAWHTWLVGGMGGGGNANGPIGDNTTTATGGDIFALDITDPGNFSEANASTLVIGDWGPNGTPISCVANTPANCGNNLGNTYGTPIIRRLHDGNWGVIFGNGLNSPTGTAGIYIMEVSSTGAITFRFLDTGYGPSQDPLGAGNKNGISYVSSADLDGDHVTDYVYAGDRFGNLWRFDLTSNTAGNWKAGSAPLFSTPISTITTTVGSTVISTLVGQPITTRVTVTSALAGSNPGRVMISFGTGQQLPQTLTSAASYASGVQTLYGIWDWNMTAWNALGSVQYASLAAPQAITTAKLQAQTASDVPTTNYRTVTQNKICWAGSATCSPATSNTQFGWQLNLPDSGEQIIYNPTIAYGLFVVNTTIPGVNNVITCANPPPSGYTMAIAADTGGAPTSSFFASATNNYVSANGAVVAGIGLNAVGTPSFVSAMTKPYMVNQTVTGEGSITQVNPGAAGIGQRLNWIRLR
ncbi:MAG: Type IV fimbrial biogenesis protein PilY1 [Burkholderiaceae bacterium]|jgi:type IV pilus assembly protein PilY1|nr:MAG: Type IV fimbrial biogenesis protein PilY1 [Burkholderiaceae bacterium]